MTKPLSPTVESLIQRSSGAFVRRLMRKPLAEVMAHTSRQRADIPVHLVARRVPGAGSWTMKWHLGPGTPGSTARAEIPAWVLQPAYESDATEELADVARSALTAHAASTPGAVATFSDG